jgi:sugar fermentation stimulation protein A
MLTCLPEQARVWLSPSSDPKRKLKYTWQLLEADGGWVMVNPGLANDLVDEALGAGQLEPLKCYAARVREVPFGAASRIDFALYDAVLPAAKPKARAAARSKRAAPESEPDPSVERSLGSAPSVACWLEVKQATYALGPGRLAFPDSVTERGTKHLRELISAKSEGRRAVLLFHAARSNSTSVEPADAVDPVYGRTLREAIRAGVELLAYRLELGFEAASVVDEPSGLPPRPWPFTERPVSIRLGEQVPVRLP